MAVCDILLSSSGIQSFTCSCIRNPSFEIVLFNMHFYYCNFSVAEVKIGIARFRTYFCFVNKKRKKRYNGVSPEYCWEQAPNWDNKTRPHSGSDRQSSVQNMFIIRTNNVIYIYCSCKHTFFK